MRMFKRLADFFSFPTPAEGEKGFQIPFDFTPSEWSEFKELEEDERFFLFLKALDEVATFSGEAILASSSDENLHYYRGFVMGLRKAAFLVREAANSERDYLENERKRERLSDSGTRNAVLFGTPGWRKPT